MQNDPVAALVAKLEQGGFAPRPTGSDSWESRCPAHGGRRPQPFREDGGRRQGVIHCHREPACEPPKIMAAIGMTMADLFPSGPACTPPSGDDKANARPKPKHCAYQTPEAALDKVIRERGEPTAFWTYSATDGSEEFRVYRFDAKNPKTGEPEKEYRPVHLTPRGGLSATRLDGCPCIACPSWPTPGEVFVCEGEKACDLAEPGRGRHRRRPTAPITVQKRLESARWQGRCYPARP